MAADIEALGRERELIRSCQAGDEAALSALYERHFSPIYRYVLAAVGDRQDAEDVAAEVFLAAFRGIKRYQPGSKPIAAWLFRIAHNEVKNHFRRKGRRLPTTSLDSQQTGVAERYDIIEGRVLLMDLAAALRVLSEGQREALLLRLAAGMSTRETALVMGRPEGTVRSLLHHGIKTLRALMEAGE